MTTTFQKNVRLNNAFGNKKGDITAPDFGRIQTQAKLVLEETRELLEAAFYDCSVKLDLVLTPKQEPYQTKTIQEILKDIMDAQGDITTVNDGVAHITGFDGDECLQRVYASNMSKFVRFEDEVGPALDYYYSRGFPAGQLRIEGEFPQACIKVVETVTWNGKEYPAGKFLKNMATFQEPDFTDMVEGKPFRQVTDIIITSTLDVNQIAVSAEGVVAFASLSLIEQISGISEPAFQASHEGVVESYVPIFKLDGELLPNTPELWGTWKANVRIYTTTPVIPSITQLTRID